MGLNFELYRALKLPRYSSKFRPISYCREQRHQLPSKTEDKQQTEDELGDKMHLFVLGTFRSDILDKINTQVVSMIPIFSLWIVQCNVRIYIIAR